MKYLVINIWESYTFGIDEELSFEVEANSPKQAAKKAANIGVTYRLSGKMPDKCKVFEIGKKFIINKKQYTGA